MTEQTDFWLHLYFTVSRMHKYIKTQWTPVPAFWSLLVANEKVEVDNACQELLQKVKEKDREPKIKKHRNYTHNYINSY